MTEMQRRSVAVDVAGNGYTIKTRASPNKEYETMYVETALEKTLERVLVFIAPYRATGIKVHLEDPYDLGE